MAAVRNSNVRRYITLLCLHHTTSVKVKFLKAPLNWKSGEISQFDNVSSQSNINSTNDRLISYAGKFNHTFRIRMKVCVEIYDHEYLKIMKPTLLCPHSISLSRSPLSLSTSVPRNLLCSVAAFLPWI